LALALVRDLRELRVSASGEELASFETDVLAGFVLARASAGLADSTIRNDTGHLELIRDQPTDIAAELHYAPGCGRNG
jgi:integrase/recombinase XerD